MTQFAASSWVIALVVGGFSAGDDFTGTKPERSITEIRRDVREMMKAEATADRGSTLHVATIGRLLVLHGEMVRHTSFQDGFVLRESRSLLGSRLIRVARRIESTVDRRTTERRRHIDEPGRIVLAQFNGPNAGAGAAPAAANGGLAGGGAAIGALPDYGEELADLIRQVINPEFWDTAGGPGTVVYFQSRYFLVVRATLEVHENITQFLWDMRAAGGP